MSRPPRGQRNPAVLRSRFRPVLFLLLATGALLVGAPWAALAAFFGVLVGLASMVVARSRGHELAYTFVVVDWLLLGCAVSLAGGMHSWLLIAVPFFAAAYLSISPRLEWPYLVAPALVLLIVLAIADPSLGGNKVLGISLITVLVAGGVLGAHRLSLKRAHVVRPVRVDATTGLYPVERLHELGSVRLAVAAAEAEPVSLVYAQMAPLDGGHHGLSVRSRGALAREAARRLRGHLERRDLAFRLPQDGFALLLPGRSADAARVLAAKAAEEISSDLIAGQRQTLVFGVASFPPGNSIDELLAVAQSEAQASLQALVPEQQAGLLATAQ